MKAPEKDKITFFIDGKEIVTEQSSILGRDIKVQARIPGEYQLFLEVEGDQPDKSIPDDETVSLSGPTKHFYAVPPATFGQL